MESGRSTSGRTKLGVMVMLMGLLTGTFSIFGPTAEAVDVPPDPGGVKTGFEIDGDEAHEVEGKLDWQDLAGLTPASDGDSLTIVTDDTGDSGLQGSSKEDDPLGWSCDVGGDDPADANILKAAVNIRQPGNAGPFLDLALVREKGLGSSHVNFEFNQNATTSPCPLETRTTGDLLISANFPGGAESAAVEIFLWVEPTAQEVLDGEDGHWAINNSFPASAAAAASNGAVNPAQNDIVDYIFGMGTITTRNFGEASLDLSAVLGSGQQSCVSFGEVNIRSRTSGSSLEAALSDRLPATPVDLSTCGKISLEKEDDAGNALDGARFGLWPSNVAVPAVGAGGTRPTTGSVDTCVTGELAGTADTGKCTFNDVNPGSYNIAEISPPAGYAIDPHVEPVVVVGRTTTNVTYTWVDPRDTGSVLITKAVTDGGQPFAVDPADLAGLTFTLEQGGVQVNTWPPPGDPAQCSLDGVTLSCEIGPVPLGDYVVTEDPNTLPEGISQGPDANVTIDEDGETVEATITNPLNPININLEKAGPDTANVGDIVNYTFDVTTTGEPLTITQLVEIIDLPNNFENRCDTAALTGPNKSVVVDPDNDGDAVLEAGEAWRWTCQHTVTLADATDADGALLQNKAEVTGEDSFGREVSDDDTHTVTILLPDISVDKTPDGATILPGDEAEYTIVGTNDGPGRANDVTLADALPDGIDWAVGGADGGDCSITPDVGTVGQQLSCDFGDIAANDSRTIIVSGVTDSRDCGVLPNTATVDASNDDEDSDDASITVSCADVTVAKTPDGGLINAGETASFTIVVTNLSATADATDVTLADALPDGIDWAVGGADGGDCSITPDVGTVGQDLSCDFGTLTPSATRTVTVSGETDAADCGRLPNTAVVSSSNEAEGADDNNSDDALITVQCPDLVIEKSTTTGTVSAGQDISFDITVTNNGPGIAFGVTLTDTLPTGAGVSWSENSTQCSIAGGMLSCAFGDLASGGSASVTLSSATTEASCKTYDNTATADATNDDPVSGGASIVVQCPDLQITKVADDPSTVTAGDDVGFTITVTNGGPGTAFGVTLNDPLPSGDGIDWQLESQSGGAACAIDGAPGAEMLTCGPKDLANGASFSVHVVSDTQPTGQVCSAATLSNTATADAANDAPVTATASVTIQCPNVTITKVADAASVSAGSPIGFVITVSNGGPGIARGVTLSDQMPAGVNWTLASSTPSANCNLSAGELLTCGPVDLASPGSFTAHVVANTDESDCALYTNTAHADATNDDPVEATDNTLVKCPGLNITKNADDPETVTAGDPVGFVIEVTNDSGEGVGTATGVTLNDPLPVGDGVSWSIQSQTGGAGCVVNGTAPTQTLACGPIDLDPGEGFSVHVVSDTDPSGAECVSGTLPNTATADATNHAPITATDTITIQCPDITITKVADDDVVNAGQDIGFTISVSNAGPGVARDVGISDPLPVGAGVTWTVDPAVEGCTILAGILLCEVGDIASEGSFSVHVTGTTPGGIGNPDLPAACKVYSNTVTAVVANDADETASDSTEVICPLDITIVKDGPALAHRGDKITYTFTVTNSGEADLVSVVLTDPICDAGTLVLVDDADGNTTLSVGEVWAYECTRVITATDPDPLPNTATVVGTDVRQRTTDDQDDHLVDLIAPAIQVVKTVDDDTPDVGQTVTFTYVVTNTGDTTLFNVKVVDDQLGAIGTIPELAAGASATLTKTMVVAANSPTRNVATATGADVLGKTVTDDDDATIAVTVVLGEVIVPAPAVEPAPLPRTGSDPQLLLLVSGALLLLGGLLVASGGGWAPPQTVRRRQS